MVLFCLVSAYVGCDLEAFDISCVFSTGLLAKCQFSKDIIVMKCKSYLEFLNNRKTISSMRKTGRS